MAKTKKMFQGGNPIMRKAFKNVVVGNNENVMTMSGTITRTLFLFAILFLTATYSWNAVMNNSVDGESLAIGFMGLGLIGGFIFSLITIFAKKVAKFTAPIYALFEGLFLGSMTAIVSITINPTIGVNALAITLGLFGLVAFAYKFGFVRATEKFRFGVIMATSAIFLVYMVDIILNIFGMNIPLIHQTGWVGMGINVAIIIVATLNIVLDFDFIERAAAGGAPKYMEWYGGFSLMLTLVWLYVEIVRLLITIYASRD